MKLIIDNTTRPGNFFDKINNQSYTTKEYYICEMNLNDNIIKEIKPDSFIKIEDEYDENYTQYVDKYDYINTNTLNKYIDPELELIYKNDINDVFKLSKEQYKQYLIFIKNHKNCLVDCNLRHRFGTIGGGIIIKYKVNYNYEEKFLIFKFVKCEYCKDEEALTGNIKDFEISDEELEQKYNNYYKYPIFTKVEFYRFMEIYREYKESLIVEVMGTGLGNLISVKTKNYIFSITDYSNW